MSWQTKSSLVILFTTSLTLTLVLGDCPQNITYGVNIQVMVPYQDEYKFSLQKVVVAVEQARMDAVQGDALEWTGIENLNCLVNVSRQLCLK